MAPAPSLIRQYFRFLDGKAKCIVCDKEYAPNSTTNMKNHLQSKHRNLYAEYQMQIDEDGVKSSRNKNEAVEDNPATTHKIYRALMEYVVFANLPLEHIQGVPMRRLLRGIGPRHGSVDIESFKKYVNDDEYENILGKVKEEIRKNHYVSLTAYIWKDPTSTNNILIISNHGLSETFERSSMILKCAIFDENATGDVVSEILKTVCTDLNISTKQVHCMIRDERSSLKRVTEPVLPIQDLDCTIHKIQTIIRETFLSEENITVFKRKFDEISENSTTKSLSQDIKEALNLNATDWESTYNKFKTLFSMAANYSIKTGNLTSTLEEKWVETRDDVMKCFELANYMYDSQEFLSSMYPIFKAITISLTKYLALLPEANIFGAALTSLKTKFETTLSSLEHNNVYLIATFLDPRYKFIESNNNIRDQILKMANTDDGMDIIPSPNVENVQKRKIDSSDSDMTIPNKISKESEGNVLKKYLSKSGDVTMDQKSRVLLKEIFDYEDMPSLDYDEDPLEWWKNYGHKFKNLSKFARRFLAPPAASVVNEQLFGEGGSLELNSKLKYIFMKHNIVTFNFNY